MIIKWNRFHFKVATNNSLYANDISGGEYGVIVGVGSANNNIYENVISNSSSYGLFVNGSASGNVFNSNTIKDVLSYSIRITGSDATKNIFKNNQLSDSLHGVSLNNNVDVDTTFTINKIIDIIRSGNFLSNVSEIKFNNTMFSNVTLESDGTLGNLIIISDSGIIRIKDDRSDKFMTYDTNNSTLRYNVDKKIILSSKL